MTGHWIELDHTADVAISVYGSDLETLFTIAAQALFSLAYESDSIQLLPKITVILSAPDIETLLIDWLNELLYLSEKHNAFFSGYAFMHLQPTALNAQVEATSIRTVKRTIKAATFHNIAINEGPDGYQTEIVFDT